MRSTLKSSKRIRGVHPLVKAAVLALSFGVAGAAVADPRPDHYESVAPANAKDAHVALAEAVSGITKAFAAHDFEEIHRGTYVAGKAAAVFTNAGTIDPELSERLVHTVEIVHLASEIKSGEILAIAVPELDDVSRKALSSKN
jgi:hypothetical protein